MLRGHIEAFSSLEITGWIFSQEAAAEGVDLRFSVDGVTLAAVRANQFRPDLEMAGLGTGHCAFQMIFDPPLTPDQFLRGRLSLAGTGLAFDLPRPEAPRPTVGAVPDTGLKVFIVGAPRTGTSALYGALRNTFNLPGPGEGHVIPALSHALHSFRTYIERFRQVEQDVLIRQFPKRGFEEVMFDFFRSFYLERFGGSGWVDKTPSDEAVHGAVVIGTLFPDSKLIITTRGLLETVASYRSKFGSTVEEGARVWLSVKEGIESLKRAGVDFLTVDQRSLESDPEGVARAIATYLGKPERSVSLANNLRVRFMDETSLSSPRTELRLENLDWTPEEKAFVAAIQALPDWPVEPK